MTVPLKLKDSASADFVQFSSTEENYLAYQAGLHLASGDSSDVGSLALNVHGTSTTIGNLTDTSYDQAVGTGGDNVSITFSTTTTPVRQTKGTITPSGSNNRLPVMFRDSDGQTVIREMNDSDMSVMLDRINTRIFTSDYPGTYKLATSTPAGGYTLDVANVTTDTRTDGTSTQHNLYRRTSMTAPTKVLPFSIKRSSGDTGTYQGLQLMSDDQVKYSIGTRLQNKISSTANGVGSYKIYSSAAGTPTSNGLSGTWTAKGTATDTRQAIVDANYTRGRVSTYARLRTSTYSADYQRTRNSAFSRSSNVARTSTYTATYTKTRVSTYTVSGFLGNFIGNYVSTATKDYTRTSTRDVAYAGNYGNTFTANYSRLFEYTGNFGSSVRSSTVVTAYTGNYTNTFIGNYTRQAQYIGNYTGDFVDSYTRDRQAIAGANYSRNFVGNYSRNYLRNRSSNYSRNYLRTSIVSFEGNYQRNRVENFTGDYTRNFSRDFSSDFTRTSINEMGYQTAYMRGRAKGGFQYYVGNFTGLAYYSRNIISSTGSWSSYSFSSSIGSPYYMWFTPPSSSVLANYRSNGFTGSSILQSENGAPLQANEAYVYFFIYWNSVLQNGLHSWNDLYANDAALYCADGDGFGTTSGADGIAEYKQISQWSGSGTMPTYDEVQAMGETDRVDFINNITRIVNGGYEYEKGSFSGLRSANHNAGTFYDGYYYSIRRRLITAGTTPADYASSFVGNYSRVTRTSTRSSNYTRTSTTSFEGNYLRTSTTSYTGNYARNFTRTFVGNYSRNFTRTRSSNYLGGEGYTRDFVGNFTGNYTRDFTATFEGNYSRNFVGNFIGNYGRNFLGNYNRTFTGDYIGEQIGSGSTNIETYTLYVRTA